MAAAAILDFENVEILGPRRLKTAKIRHSTKFRADRPLLRYGHLFFSRWRPPPSRILKMWKFYGWEGSRRQKCITMPNFAAIGQTVAEI